MDNQLITYLQFSKPISENDQAEIINAFEKKTYKEGDYLFEADHVIKHLFFICDGILRILVRNEQGNEITHFFLKEDHFCTILYSFNNQVVANESIRAACDTEVLVISKSKLMQLYDRLPFLKESIDHLTQQTLLEKINIRSTYLGYDSSTRYQLFLERQPEIARRVPLSDIASYLGITPQSLSRIRRNIR
jgi:CRP-like cAMP-binding protein